MAFADIRVEWRVADIERSLHQKAESYQIESLRSNIGNLENSLREALSCIDGLRSALDATLERVEMLERKIEDI